MQPAQLASARAHALLAELISLGVHLDQPLTVAARSEDASLQVIVTVSRYDGPMKLYLTPAGAELLRLPQSPPTPTPAALRDIESAALKASGKTPVTIKALARKAGYSYGSYFRDAVRRLIDLGLLVKVTGGVKLSENARQ